MPTLVYHAGIFRLDGEIPDISFDRNGARVGCHSLNTDAMDELTRLWLDFRAMRPERVISRASQADQARGLRIK